MDKIKNRKWQVNYVVSYQGTPAAQIYRKSVLDILKNIAFVRGIDCVITCDHPELVERLLSEGIPQEETLVDLVYFRCSYRAEISAKAFRQLIDHVFEEQQEFALGKYPFEVFSQMQKNLHLYPYPKGE